jgi:hypothetical protein
MNRDAPTWCAAGGGRGRADGDVPGAALGSVLFPFFSSSFFLSSSFFSFSQKKIGECLYAAGTGFDRLRCLWSMYIWKRRTIGLRNRVMT